MNLLFSRARKSLISVLIIQLIQLFGIETPTGSWFEVNVSLKMKEQTSDKISSHKSVCECNWQANRSSVGSSSFVVEVKSERK